VTWILIAIAGWLAVAMLVGLFAWTQGRSAGMALEFKRALEADKRALDRREGSKDRRVAARPWAENSSGRRAEDALRQDLADVEQALRDAEARLAEIEGRQSA
jgi:hypothetical protein